MRNYFVHFNKVFGFFRLTSLWNYISTCIWQSTFRLVPFFCYFILFVAKVVNAFFLTISSRDFIFYLLWFRRGWLICIEATVINLLIFHHSGSHLLSFIQGLSWFWHRVRIICLNRLYLKFKCLFLVFLIILLIILGSWWSD